MDTKKQFIENDEEFKTVKYGKLIEIKSFVEELNEEEVEITLRALIGRMCKLTELYNGGASCKGCSWRCGFCRELYSHTKEVFENIKII